jgi:hypothetical protein
MPTGQTKPYETGGQLPNPFTAKYKLPPEAGKEERVKQQKAKPSYFDQAMQGILSLPPQAFGSFSAFGAAGGLNALLAPLAAGNPLLALGLKFLPGLFDRTPRMEYKEPVDVNVINFKDDILDVFTILNSRISFSDTFSRRNILASPMIMPSGGASA